MSDIFQFPEISNEQKTMCMFRTPIRRQNDKLVMQLAALFGVSGKAQDAGSRTIVQDRRSTLEVFAASDSVWWTLESRETEEPQKPVKLPNEKEAVGMARDFLREHELYDRRAKATSVTYTDFAQFKKRQKEPVEYPIAQHVNFGFSLEKLPVMGPGAKTQVTFGSTKRVTEAYKFWRKPVRDREMKIIGSGKAIDLLRKDRAFADLLETKARVVFHGAQLGYYALPPREVQGCLIPVYAFEGTASTPYLERYDFVKYVVAVSISPEEAKREGAVLWTPAPVF